MNTRKPAPSSEAPLRQDLLYALRYYLGGRRAWLALAALAGLGGLVLNWNWLVVIGVAPLLIAVLPCVAMGALGMCMMGKSSRSEQPTGTGAQREADARLRGEHAIPPPVSVEETSGPLAQVEYSDPPRTMQSLPKRGRTTRPSPTVYPKRPSKGVDDA